MSTVTAVGPATTLDGPTPSPPPQSLLLTDGVLVEEAQPGDRSRWLNGAGIWGYPEGVPSAWDPCSTDSNRTKSDDSVMDSYIAEPFGIYLPLICSSLGLPDDFEERATRALVARQSFAVERVIADGLAGLANPYFGDLNMDRPIGNTAQTPSVGLRYLEDAIGDSGSRGMIHITPPIGAALAPIRFSDNLSVPLVTLSGNRVVIGGGYADVDPDGAAAAPAAGQAWAYATGPVEVRLSEVTVMPDNIGDAMDQSTNEVIYRAERFVLATFDRSVQAGVLINWLA